MQALTTQRRMRYAFCPLETHLVVETDTLKTCDQSYCQGRNCWILENLGRDTVEVQRDKCVVFLCVFPQRAEQ